MTDPLRSPPLRLPSRPWLVALTLLTLLSGCRPSPALTVNEREITVADVVATARAAGVRPDDPDLLEGVILEALLLQDAAALGVVVAADDLAAAMTQAAAAAGGEIALQRRVQAAGFSVRRYRNDLERRLLSASYLDRLSADLHISDGEVRAHFERNRERFTEPERFAVSLLVYPDEAAAAAAREALLAGRPLGEALAAAGPGSGASELSASETSPSRRALLAAAHGTPFGTPSVPVPAGEHHVVLVPTGHRPAYRPSFEEIAPSLRAQLEQQAAQALLRDRLATLRAAAAIEWGLLQPDADRDNPESTTP